MTSQVLHELFEKKKEGAIGSSLPRLHLTHRYTIAAICTVLRDFISESALATYEDICG